MTTFNEAKEVKIDSIDRNAFMRLGTNRDFVRLRRIIEDYVLQRTHNIAVGTAVSREARYLELDKLAGFTEYWLKFTNLIDDPTHHGEGK